MSSKRSQKGRLHSFFSVFLLVTLNRYLEAIKGKSGDAFGMKVGDYLLKSSKVMVEAAPEKLLFQIAHNLILTTKDAQEPVSIQPLHN